MKNYFFNGARVLVATLMAMLVLSCATRHTPQGASSAAQQKVENLIHFDTASCQQPSGIVSSITHEETILGGMLSVQPAILECFVPPANRQGNQNIHVTLTTSVNSQTVLHKVEGENLSPAGVACIKSALAPLQFQLLSPEEAEETVSIAIHYPTHSPQVVFGINEVSDIVGRLRLLISKACHCYAPMENIGIAEISMALTVSEKQPAHISLSGNNSSSHEIASCLTPELAKLNLRASRGELVLERVPLQFINSKIESFPPEAKSELLFLHTDGLRTHNASILALRLGEKMQAETAYNQLVSRHRARAASVSVRDLNISCGTLTKATEGWVSAIETQFNLDKRVADISARLRSNDARWEAVANRASDIVPESRAALVEAQKTLASNKNACQRKVPTTSKR